MGTTPAPPVTTPDAGPQQEVTFAAEHGLIGSRSIVFATRNVPPPAELYVVADDGLLVTITNIQAGLTVLISAQLLLPDGRLSSNQFQCQPPATATPTQYLFPLAEGYLFNVTVQPSPGLRHGSCWVTAAIRRGGLTSGVTLQMLIQDYVDAFSGPTWPGGLIRGATDGTGLLQSQYQSSSPVGTDWTFTVPANTRVRMRSLMAFYNASAQAATRQPGLIFSDPAGNQVYNDTIEPTVVASGSIYLCWALLLGWTQTVKTGGQLVRGLPDIQLAPGSKVTATGNAIQSGDQWSFLNFSWEQWFSV